jgi:hypothetical protein
MTMTPARPPFPWVSLLLLAVLCALAPYAMSFTPSPGLYPDRVWAATSSSDPIFARRAVLIVFGLASTIAAAIEFCLHLRRRFGPATVLTSYTVLAACAVIGWRPFPYWLNGAYAFESDRVPYTDLDPKGLVPMTWVGDFWRLGVFAIYPATALAIVAGLIAAVAYIRQRRLIRASIPLAAAGIAAVFLLAFSPGYMSWLLD